MHKKTYFLKLDLDSDIEYYINLTQITYLNYCRSEDQTYLEICFVDAENNIFIENEKAEQLYMLISEKINKLK